MRTQLLTVAAAAVLMMAAPAFARGGNSSGGGTVTTSSVPTVASNNNLCTLADLDPNASECAGYYLGNQLGGNPDALATQANAFSLLGVGSLTQIEKHDTDGTSDNVFNFTTSLNGATVIGVHWGSGAGSPIPDSTGGGTAFYLLNLAADANLFSVTGRFAQGNSGYALYKTSACDGACGSTTEGGVPEPATWAMMILGFFGAGSVIRRRKLALA